MGINEEIRRVSRRRSQISALVVGLTIWAAVTGAQTRTAALEGVVRDASGGVVPFPEVTLLDSETNQDVRTTGDAQGHFRLSELRVGTYEVRVDCDGFAPYRHAGVTLLVGQTSHLVIDLQAPSVAETVSVTAQPPPLDRAQTAITTSVDTERIEELPVRSRNYLEFALLAPAVTRSTLAPAGTGIAAPFPDSGFSFGGLRPRSNTLSIDGLDNSDEFTGGSRTELSLEAVREFQVVNNGWTAENGGAAGGSINVVTKSGANVIHGDAFLFGQFGALNALPKLEPAQGERPALTRIRAGLAVGGPVVRDRTFFYGALEREHTNGESASTIEPEAIPVINEVLAFPLFQGFGTRHLSPDRFPTARRETEWSAKLTHQLAGASSLEVRAAGSESRNDQDAFNIGGLVDVSARGSRAIRDTAAIAAWRAALTSHLTNEIRTQLARRRLALHGTDRSGAGVVISGVAEFGTPYAGDNTHESTYVDVGDVVGVALGRHFMKAGGGLRHVGLSGTSSDGSQGLYVFRTLAAFEHTKPDSFRQTFGASDLQLSEKRLQAFIQDHWTLAPTLTIDLGARFDATNITPGIGAEIRQLSSRAGVAWMPTHDWVIRGGIGGFGDRAVLASLERAWLAQHRSVFEQIVDGDTAELVLAETLGAPLRSPVEAVAPSTYAVRQGTWSPGSRQLSAGVERQLTVNLTASINYLDVRGHQLARTLNVNLPAPRTLGIDDSLPASGFVPQQIGRPIFPAARLDPAWDGIFELQPTASSRYRALIATINRRLATEIEWAVAYTWAHAEDSASDFDEQPQNPYALREEWSNSRYDERHRIVASAVFDLPIGDEETNAPVGGWARAFSHISLAPILTISSGRPLNSTTGADDNRTEAWPLTARPLGFSRNDARLPGSAILDLRLVKYFVVKPHGKLDLVVEAFNLLNRTNVIGTNTVYGPNLSPLAAYGRAIEALSARQIQFSIDFEF